MRFFRLKAFLFALCGLLVILTTGCSAKARVARHVKRGDSYYTRQEWPKAKLEYLSAARKGSHDPRVLSRLADCFLKEGEVTPAYQCLLQARTMQPTNI